MFFYYNERALICKTAHQIKVIFHMMRTLIYYQDQDHPHGKEIQKSKTVQEGLTNSCEKREVNSKGEKERYKHLNAEFQRITKRDKKAFFSDQWKEIEENN